MPAETAFWDRHAEGYAKRPVADQASYEKKLAVTRRYFRPDMEVLEFGCGTGSTALLHAPHVGRLDAYDISPGMVAIAERKLRDSGIENLTFGVSSIEDLEIPDSSKDMVLALSILHLLKDRAAVLDQVHRMLKPGGLFVTSTVCLGDSLPMQIFRVIGPIGRALGLLPLVRVIPMERLLRELKDAGFLIDYCWRPGPTKSAFIVAKKPA